MKRLKTVISGLGRIGWQFHIPAMKEHGGFDLVAACDPLSERREEGEETFGLKGYADYIDMLTAEKPDLVVIASPTHVHKEQAIYAMEQGFDVFLDKPMAKDIVEAETIAAAMERTGKKLMMYQPRRADPVTQSIKRVIDMGVIGKIFMVKCNWAAYVFRNDWQAFKKYGGGMLNNYGAHAIDKALYLTGDAGVSAKVKSVHGYMNNIASAGDADDVVKVLIETDNRVAIDIDINMASAYNGLPHLMIHGQYGVLYQDNMYGGKPCRVRYYDPAKKPEVVASEELAAADRKYINNARVDWIEDEYPVLPQDTIPYYDTCYDYYALDKTPFIPVEETLTVMRVMDQCRKTANWVQ